MWIGCLLLSIALKVGGQLMQAIAHRSGTFYSWKSWLVLNKNVRSWHTHTHLLRTVYYPLHLEGCDETWNTRKTQPTRPR